MAAEAAHAIIPAPRRAAEAIVSLRTNIVLSTSCESDRAAAETVPAATVGLTTIQCRADCSRRSRRRDGGVGLAEEYGPERGTVERQAAAVEPGLEPLARLGEATSEGALAQSQLARRPGPGGGPPGRRGRPAAGIFSGSRAISSCRAGNRSSGTFGTARWRS